MRNSLEDIILVSLWLEILGTGPVAKKKLTFTNQTQTYTILLHILRHNLK